MTRNDKSRHGTSEAARHIGESVRDALGPGLQVSTSFERVVGIARSNTVDLDVVAPKSVNQKRASATRRRG